MRATELCGDSQVTRRQSSHLSCCERNLANCMEAISSVQTHIINSNI